MTKQHIIMGVIIIFLLQFSAFFVYCQDTDRDTSSDSPGDVLTGDFSPGEDGIKELNNIVIDTEKKEIRIHCHLAITEGILEFFLVDVKGNTYESVFKVADNKPSELHFGLLLLGFEPVPYPEYQELLTDENGLAELKKKKCLLECTIQQDGKVIPLSSIIRSREKDKDTKAIWVFTGAAFTKDNKYIADYTSSYMSIWPMMESVINLFSSAGNPYRGEFGYEMAKDLSFTPEDEFILILRGVE